MFFFCLAYMTDLFQLKLSNFVQGIFSMSYQSMISKVGFVKIKPYIILIIVYTNKSNVPDKSGFRDLAKDTQVVRCMWSQHSLVLYTRFAPCYPNYIKQITNRKNFVA